MLDDARAVMKQHWGHEQFRPGQEEAIRAALEQRDALVILPTGGGKSLCYQLPALMADGLTLVISPLIALMQDQVAGLHARGISAAFINSTLAKYEIDQRWTNAEHGQYDLVYVAPERLTSELFQARAERLNVAMLAVDEAHCVSEWGHHFRPDYMAIPEARELLGHPPTMAVTATATPAVRRDVIEHLDLDEPEQIVRGFDRPNLVWSVFQPESKRSQAKAVVERLPGSGILYAATRNNVKQWARWLENALGESVAAYHGGMKSEARTEAQEQWVTGEKRLIVATNAFGMGIDKPDVRFVLHVDMPASLEAYYQEAGRAGRNGEKAYAVLLHKPSDTQTQHALIEASHPSAAEVQAVYNAVCNVGQVPLGSEPEGPLAIDQDAVTRVTGFTRTKVRTAIELLSRQDAWTVLPRSSDYAFMRFTASVDAVRNYAHSTENIALGQFVRTLLRSVHADAFSGWHRMDLRLLRRRTELEAERLHRGLDFLSDRGLIDWRPPGQTLYVELNAPRSRSYPVDSEQVKAARKRAEARLDHMVHYAHSATCRRHFLLTYFGERTDPRCGACDVCLGRHTVQAITPADEPVLRHILKQVAAGKTREAWFDGAPNRSVLWHRLSGLVDWLIREDYLELIDPLEGTFELTPPAEQLLDRIASEAE